MFTLLFFSAALASSVDGKLGFDAILPITTPQFQCFKNLTYEFYIARVFRSNGNLDNTGTSNIVNARLAGLATDAYLFPCFASGCGNGTDQKRAILVTKSISALRAAGARIDTLWLDIEKFAWKDDKEANKAFIQEMIDAAKGFGVKTGIYTAHIWWAEIVGDWKGGADLPLWWARYNKEESMDHFRSFGGWTAPTIHQMDGDIEGPCGIADIDQDYML